MKHSCVNVRRQCKPTHLVSLDGDWLEESLQGAQVDHPVRVTHSEGLVLVIPRQLRHRHCSQPQVTKCNKVNFVCWLFTHQQHLRSYHTRKLLTARTYGGLIVLTPWIDCAVSSTETDISLSRINNRTGVIHALLEPI